MPSKKVSIPYRLVAGPGATGYVDIYTVPPGKILHAKRVVVHFPSGVAGELRVALYYGNMRVYPDKPYVSGDDVTFDDKIDVTFWSQDSVRLWYENTNAAEPRSCHIKLEGGLV